MRRVLNWFDDNKAWGSSESSIGYLSLDIKWDWDLKVVDGGVLVGLSSGEDELGGFAGEVLKGVVGWEGTIVW